jgi:positive regulator of sigma E activity
MDDQEQTWAEVRQRRGDDVFVAVVSDNNSCATGGCGASGAGCQTNAFVGLFSPAPLLKLVNVPTDIHTGDWLLLSLPRRAVFQLAALGYGLPLLMLLVGLWLGQTLAGDLGALTLGMSSLLLAWLIIGKLGLAISPTILEVKSVSA